MVCLCHSPRRVSDPDQDVLPQFPHPLSVLSSSIESPSSLFQRYSFLARKTYHSVTDTTTKFLRDRSPGFLDIFDLSSVSSTSKSEPLEKFLTSLNNAISFVEKSQGESIPGRFGAFEVIGLEDIEREWGRESEQYLTAAAALNAIIQSVSWPHILPLSH